MIFLTEVVVGGLGSVDVLTEVVVGGLGSVDVLPEVVVGGLGSVDVLTEVVVGGLGSVDVFAHCLPILLASQHDLLSVRRRVLRHAAPKPRTPTINTSVTLAVMQ